MGKHDFRYFFHEGVSNMFSHGFMSFAAIGITVACLLIMGTFSLVAWNANALLEELEQENEILAYVDDSYTGQQAKALESKLEKVPNVASATFISKETAMKNFAEQYPEEELFQNLDPEIFRDRFSLKLYDLELMGETKADIEDVDGIAKVNAYEEVAGGFITIRNVATVVCVALIVILFVVSVFIISNTIKLTVYSRRLEIAIMKAVGATNAFIRMPFVVEGAVLGLISAALSYGITWLAYDKVLGMFDGAVLGMDLVPFDSMWWLVLVAYVAGGMLTGILGSGISMGRYLKDEGGAPV